MKNAVPSSQLGLYEKLVARRPDVERKGAAMPYTSLNGHMFSFLTETGTLALRLPDGDREAFLEKYKTKLCERHGTVMKEYAVVPASLLAKTAELGKWFDRSIAHVASLKPKATAKKGAGKKSAAK
jgi:hypothetical protein